MHETQCEQLLGFSINQKPLGEVVALSLGVVKSGQGQHVFSCANPHSLAVARSDRDFRSSLKNSEILVADGIGVSLATQVLMKEGRPRITGSDYFTKLMSALNDSEQNVGRRLRVFFLGSTENVLSRIEARLKRDYEHIDVAGMLSPPFGDWAESVDRNIVERINAAKPDVLWVGMTAPKQEKWVAKNRSNLDVRIIGSIGAVFDFYAETYPRAPAWMVSSGLEWLHRFWLNPRKMWRRNFISTPIFLFDCIRWRLGLLPQRDDEAWS